MVMVTARLSADGLYAELTARQPLLLDAGIRTLIRVGDCLSPGTIAAAVYGGHRAARGKRYRAYRGTLPPRAYRARFLRFRDGA